MCAGMQHCRRPCWADVAIKRRSRPTIDDKPYDPHNAAFNAPVAQLDRVPGYELGGREFESLRARHISIMAGALWIAMDGGNAGKAGVFFGQPVMRREGA